jgi:hypothetical protein
VGGDFYIYFGEEYGKRIATVAPSDKNFDTICRITLLS